MIATPPANRRSALVLLFPAVLAAGYGLGLLVLAASLPPPDVRPLPAPGVQAPAQPDSDAPGTPVRAAWAPLFGEPAPQPDLAPPPEPEPDPEPVELDEDPVFYDTSQYVLRGLVHQLGGGWAFVEADGAILMIGAGDLLPGGELVTRIGGDGIDIEVDGTGYFIGFDDFADAPPLPAVDHAQPRDGRPRSDFRMGPGDPAPGRSDPRLDPAQSAGPSYTSSRDRHGLGTVGR